MKPIGFLFIAVLSLSACNPQKGRLTASRVDIENAASRFWSAHERGDADSITAMLTEDVFVMIPNADDLRGRPAVKQALMQMYSALKVTDFTIVTREIDICDSTAYELATYNETLNFKDKAAQPVRGRYLIVWKRQSNQSWLVHRNLFNLSSGAHP